MAKRAEPGERARVAALKGDPDDTAQRFVSPRAGLPGLARAAAGCTACDLHARATQTVFGEGPKDARIVLIGEQPGDAEDLAGRPFVGPAGKLLDKALADAGIDRSRVYVTNAVKHFKWIVRGKKRIHNKPSAIQIEACAPWLQAEIDRIAPDAIVCLGATAAKAVLGPSVRVTRDRSRALPSGLATCVTATVHPSALLRMPDRSKFDAEYRRFVADLRLAAKAGKG